MHGIVLYAIMTSFFFFFDIDFFNAFLEENVFRPVYLSVFTAAASKKAIFGAALPMR